MSVNKISHVNKTVFIGIDVHKRTYAISCGGEHMKVERIGNLQADPKAFSAWLKQRFSGAKIKTVYEAGFSGFCLHRELEAAGIDNIVVHAAAIERAANDRVKNDKIDAEKLRVQLQRGQLSGIYVPSVEEEAARQITRTRKQLVEKKTSIGNQIKSKLFQFGYISPDDNRVMSQKLVNEFLSLKTPADLKLAITSLASIYKAIHKEIVELDRKMREQASKDSEVEEIYRSVPGVGVITSRTLSHELGDMSRLKNQKAAHAITGLTPSEYSSGDREMRGHITRQGNRHIRGLLIEVAWRAISEDCELRSIYEKIKVRAGGKRAIVGVARQLIGRIRACQIKKEKYRIQPMTV